MLISTYDPNCQARCPNCGLVACLNTSGNLAIRDRYMDFYHADCDTHWRQYLDRPDAEVSDEGKP